MAAATVVAPVTLDNADYLYAALYQRPEYRERVAREYLPYMESVVAFFEKRSVEVVGREFPQVLLIHANQLNADVMPELLAHVQTARLHASSRSSEALQDPAYRRARNTWAAAGSRGSTAGRGPGACPNKGEPEPPAWAQRVPRCATAPNFRAGAAEIRG